MSFQQKNMLAGLTKDLPEGLRWDREEGALGIPTAWTHRLSTKGHEADPHIPSCGDFSMIREIRSVSVFRRLHVDTREPGIEPQLWPCLAPLPEAPAPALWVSISLS